MIFLLYFLFPPLANLTKMCYTIITMKKLKLFILFLALMAGAAFVFHFNFFSNYFQKKIPANIANQINGALLQKAKIEAPLEENEFEKTADYGILDCAHYGQNIFAKTMFDLINASRAENKGKKLKWSPTLCQSAELKSGDMLAHNYFEHVSPDGTQPWHWIEVAGYKYLSVGENLALNYFTADSAHTALMNSPGHRANILNPDFSEIGFYYARGKINGEDAFILVQHFATPAPASVPIKYVCETDKAAKQFKDLKKTKNEIEKYLSQAKDTESQLKAAGASTKEVSDYIDYLNGKEKEVDGYIKETNDYLVKCNS